MQQPRSYPKVFPHRRSQRIAICHFIHKILCFVDENAKPSGIIHSNESLFTQEAKMKLRNGMQLGLAGMLLAGNASAVVLAEYTFTSGSLASTDTELTTLATDINFDAWVGNAAYPGGDTPVVSGDQFVARTSVTNPAATTGITELAAALSADNFIEFTITGTDFDVTSVSFDYEVAGSNTYKYRAFVLSDVTGSVEQGSSAELVSTAASEAVAASAIVTSDWEDLNSLTVKIYVADSTTQTNGFHRIDNIIVEGTPEPGSLALLAVDGLFVLQRRRRN
ncbi:MAG: PEP-CTERM sorting domain-containing protein [Phycisphaeraceae bacterium]